MSEDPSIADSLEHLKKLWEEEKRLAAKAKVLREDDSTDQLELSGVLAEWATAQRKVSSALTNMGYEILHDPSLEEYLRLRRRVDWYDWRAAHTHESQLERTRFWDKYRAAKEALDKYLDELKEEDQ